MLSCRWNESWTDLQLERDIQSCSLGFSPLCLDKLKRFSEPGAVLQHSRAGSSCVGHWGLCRLRYLYGFVRKTESKGALDEVECYVELYMKWCGAPECRRSRSPAGDLRGPWAAWHGPGAMSAETLHWNGSLLVGLNYFQSVFIFCFFQVEFFIFLYWKLFMLFTWYLTNSKLQWVALTRGMPIPCLSLLHCFWKQQPDLSFLCYGLRVFLHGCGASQDKQANVVWHLNH